MGLLLAAPQSGSGKTTVTLGLLRALRRRGVPVRAAKSGPDHIDGRFHERATGRPCPNLDAWAMGPRLLASLASGDGPLVVEGAMGLFDGAPDGRGSAAHLARLLGLSAVLVVDAARMAQSVGPLVAGFARHDPALPLAGVILNRVGSGRHLAALAPAAAAAGVPLLGALPRDPTLLLPSRHLGLVQAEEAEGLDLLLDRVADAAERHLDLDRLLALAAHDASAPPPRLPPPARRIALARDAAFSFAYPHLLAAWEAAGATILPFSPLADEPVPPADLVLLPGGYPELHAGALARAGRFMRSLRDAAEAVDVHGECGGYMVLGETLEDADGHRHAMAGLLPLATSFRQRRLHLGYRAVHAPLGPFPGPWAAHEFHYASTLRAEGEPLLQARDATGAALPPMGLRRGRASGSFAHLIAPLDPTDPAPALEAAP